MSKQYIGHLSFDDPLHAYLKYEIQPQINGTSNDVKYRVFKLSGSNDVYMYEDKYSGSRVVGKFYRSERKNDAEKAARRLAREYHNLCLIRNCGLADSPHYVVRPLGCNYQLNDLLVVQYCDGESLSNVINGAIHGGDQGRLFYRLTALGYFLAMFHNRSGVDEPVDFCEDCDYMDRLVERLLKINAIGWDEAREFWWLRDRWREQSRMWEDRKVLVHGDATPENFLFGDGLNVICIDLERARRADRVYDVGRIVGELKHFFFRATGNKSAAEPFIGHFLWEYACHFPDRQKAFQSISSRVPFYMGTTLMRIARNNWIDNDYRRRLIDEAKSCLRRF